MTPARLFRLLTLLAWLLAPLNMVGDPAAMAMPAASEVAAAHAPDHRVAEHCAGAKAPPDEPQAPDDDCLVDCAIACSAIPAAASPMADRIAAVAMVQPLAPDGRISGLHPESDPPPPRDA